MSQTERPVSLKEMDRRVQEWVVNHPAEIEQIAKDARAAADAITRDARVTPEQLHQPVTI